MTTIMPNSRPRPPMYNAARLHRIDQMLNARRSVSFDDLQEELGVSRATLKRDLSYLRNRFNAPIVYDRDLGGYRFDKQGTGPRYELPGLWFDEAETAALVTMSQLLLELDSHLLAPHIQPLLARIDSILGDGRVDSHELRRRIRITRTGARPPTNDVFPVIGHALLGRHRLQLHYYARGTDETSDRSVSPQRLVHYRNNWYLDAWCHLRNALRSFALDGIRSAAALEEAAIDVADEELDRFFGSGWGIFSGSKVRWARLRFEVERARWVASEHWHSQQRGQFEPDGRYILELPYSDPRELITEILRHSGSVEVLEPPELRRMLRTELLKALELNPDPTDLKPD